MISREEKNKKYVNEIKKEKTIFLSKKIIKIFGIIIILFTILFLYLYFIGPKGLESHEYSILDDKIPNSFHGIKILHFSDLLYGSTINNNSIDEITEEINLINPDIVFFTGNIISENYQITQNDIKHLNDFFSKIPYKIGKYAISGDTDSSTFNLILENTNFVILDNESISIYNEKDKINLVGTNKNNKKEIKNTDLYTITLINNYDEYDTNLSSNLVLAGHNLGGEINLFGLPLLGTDKHLNNYYEENNMKIYISSGLGTKHHMRFMNRPSLNVYRLYNN